jgi:CHAD domain-containing protein
MKGSAQTGGNIRNVSSDLLHSLPMQNGGRPSLAEDPAILRAQLLKALQGRWRAYRKALKKCRNHPSEQAVHFLRVESRRLLSALELLGSFVTHSHVQKARRKLKKRLNDFSELRDTHVQLLAVEVMLREFPELKPLYRKLLRREKRLVKPAARRAKLSKTGSLARAVKRTRLHLKAAFAAPSVRCRPRERISNMLETAFERVAELRREIDPADVTTIHRTRVAFKKFRYMIELLQPILPGVTRPQLVAMSHYQTMMGDIQDLGIMLASLEALAEKRKVKAASLVRVRKVLQQRHRSLIQAYCAAADELFNFWPARFVTRHSASLVEAA